MSALQPSNAKVRGDGAIFFANGFGFGCDEVMGRRLALTEVIDATSAFV